MMTKPFWKKLKEKLQDLNPLSKKGKKDLSKTSQHEQGVTLNDFSEAPPEILKEKESLKDKIKNFFEDIRDNNQFLSQFSFKRIFGKIKAFDYKNVNLKKSNAPQALVDVGNKFKSKAMSIEWQKIPEIVFSPQSRTQINKIFLSSFLVVSCYGLGKSLALLTKGNTLEVESSGSQLPPIVATEYMASDLLIIQTANIFKTDNKKEDEDTDKPKMIDKKTKCIAATENTKLPITLINTVVLQDSVKSIASVQIRSKQDPISVREGETIDQVAKVDKITRLEVVLKNLKNGNCELLQSKDLLKKEKLPVTVLSPSASKDFLNNKSNKPGITNEGNKFKISRNMLNEKLKDISSILTQARAIKLTNPDGSMSFKITEIVPDSVYANLGIQDQDIITAIDGKKITDMNEIMGKFGRINELEHLKIDVQREGSKVTLDYNFTN